MKKCNKVRNLKVVTSNKQEEIGVKCTIRCKSCDYTVNMIVYVDPNDIVLTCQDCLDKREQIK